MSSNKPHIRRAQIRRALEEAGRPVTRRQLSHVFGLDKAQSDQRLSPVLMEMVAAGELVRNRRAAYGFPSQMDLVPGRISAHPDGYGFVVVEGDDEDLYLSPRQMRQVFNGDRVLAAVTAVDRRGRREGAVVEVIERAHQQVVGRLLVDAGVAVVVPDDPRLTQDIILPAGDEKQASPGQIVVARIDKPPTLKRSAVGRIVAVLGDADEPGMATEIAIHSHQLPVDFSEEALHEAEAFGRRIDEKAAHGRVDLRDVPLLTIDGADARDFDDAVFAEPLGDGFRVLVAIADVAEYVKPGSALDKEAAERGNSVYFPDRVIPMLPVALSNGLCSLNPDVDRLCMVCEMRINSRGRVTSSRFYEGVMRSRARLTYSQVRRIMDIGDPELVERYGHVLSSLQALYDAYRLRLRLRERRGALDFDSQQAEFRFDEKGQVVDIGLQRRGDEHRLIEELMIAANVEAARFVGRQKLPMLFRVHEPPPADKLEALEEFLRGSGLKVRWREHPEPGQFAAIQRDAVGRPDEALVNAQLLRSLSLAVYQPDNKGHFGLALENYAHFTSPIRRYPDLLLHRAIKHACRGQSPGRFDYGGADMDELGRHCSWTERRAEEAGRDVEEHLKCQFMQRHIGEEFDGLVTGVASFGLFVELDGLAVSGLVHVTELPNDYYSFDPRASSLTGKRRGQRYRLADSVKVQVIAVSVDERKIDFRLVNSNGSGD
ncbi:MAG TPA: ribonuclease R [Wenzhouxiangella sp.]|nr:ribonuclease R [Wenzhouxiangella sp.]